MRRAIACIFTLTLASVFTPTTHAEEFQDQVDEMLGDMTNVTDGGSWDTTRRGVVSGGAVSNRSRIMDPNIVSFRPPSADAGCGGIDMFGGSFSFINEQQLVQLLRSIASNAKGYAFQLALEGMCPECARQIEAFQKKIQKLNQHFGNSCQMAQGIVNDTAAAFGAEVQNDASIISQAEGAGDVFQNWSTSDGTNPKEDAQTASPDRYAEEVTGNIVWRHLTENQTGSWFTGAASVDFREALMTLTGTVVVSPIPGEPGETTKSTIPGLNVQLADLVDGGEVRIYDCDDTDENGCLNIGTESNPTDSVEISGFAEQIEEQLIGTGGGSPGIITRWATNAGSLDSGERAFVSSLPRGMGGMIQRLTARSPNSARSFVIENSRAIGLDMALTMLRDMLDATQLAMSQADHGYTKETLEVVSDSRARIQSQYRQLVSSYGKPSDIRQHYLSTLKLLEAQTGSQSLVGFN